jgi:hypothetical protein
VYLRGIVQRSPHFLSMNKRIAVIIPAYNEEKTVELEQRNIK